MDLSHVSTRDLARELAARPDLGAIVRQDGLLDSDVWPLRPKLGPVSCVDGVAIRRNEKGRLEGGIIRRGTGKFAGKLAFIGGVVALFETIEAALRRHWRTDLGIEIDLPLGWDHPVCMRQYAPGDRPGFLPDPGKHSYASTHLVFRDSGAETFGTGIGGQEATGFEWYSRVNCPAEEEWAYGMRSTFLDVLAGAEYRIAHGEIKV